MGAQASISSNSEQDLESKVIVSEYEGKAQTEEVVVVPKTSEDFRRSPVNASVLRKQDLHIIPIFFAIYLLCYLDRANIGNAKTLNSNVGHDLVTETGMSNYQYIIALMVFLIAYGGFEIPCNYFLKRLSPNKWIALIMFSWGALTMGLGGSNSFASVTIIRFLLGAAEAGLYPGLVFYLTFWYRTEERALRLALITSSGTIAGAFGGALAFAVGHMDYVGGLAAWRWLFILEGVPSLLSSILVFFFLPNYPETVNWFTEEEKLMAVERLHTEGSHCHDGNINLKQIKETLLDWRLYVHYILYFVQSCPYSSLSLFSPSIVLGLGFQNLNAQLMTVPPWAAGFVFLLLVSWSSDHFNARGLHVAVSAAVGAIGFLASGLLPVNAYGPRYGCLIIATCGALALIPSLVSWLSSNLHSTSGAGLAIGINMFFGPLGQICGVWIYKADEAAIGYPTGHFTNAALLMLLCIGSIGLMLWYRHLNAQIIKNGGVGVAAIRLYKY